MKLKSQYETEIYVSDAGYLCVKQDNPLGDSEHLVMLSPTQADAIAQYWNAVRGDAECLFKKQDEAEEA